MFHKKFTTLRALTFALTTLLSVPAAAAERPDLSGTYDVQTVTPISRPEEFGDRLTLTDEEAAQAFEGVDAYKQKAYAASDPEREAPPSGGDGSKGFGGAVGGYNSFWLERGNAPVRIDGKWRSSVITDPKNGRYPPMTGEGEKREVWRGLILHTNTGDAWWLREGPDPSPYDDPELRPIDERCILGSGPVAGPPILPFAYNNLKRVVQTDDHVMILGEMIHDARIIRLNAEHDPPEVRKWLGDSVGRWEGDTLVVDTTNFRDTPALTYASRDLHVVERLSRIDDDTLRYQFTVEDPKIWTAPWSGEYVWPATENRVYEYACHEGNYSMMGIMRGARVMEKETIEKAGKK
jgi:hypothetical protein